MPGQDVYKRQFYESGKIEKLPMTEKDVEIVRALLQKVQPHQIYVAGDLADPHEMCIRDSCRIPRCLLHSTCNR